jgi:hypothetical protein
MPDVVYTVVQGDTMIRLGEKFGLAPDTIWGADRNAELRTRRKDMNELFPGDQVFIPPVRKRTEPGATDFRHRFKRVGVPAKIRLQVLYCGAPVSNAAYTLALEDRVVKGTTGSDGVVEQSVSPLAKAGLLIVPSDGERPSLHIDVRFGHLDPLNTQEGVARRLWNLGFWRASAPTGQRLQAALEELQDAFGLERTGIADGPTLQLIEQLHDSASSWKVRHVSQ